MAKPPLDPDAHPILHSVYRTKEAEETNAKIVLNDLTAEVLRDLGRNESCSKAWRKAAIKQLMDRNHEFQFLPYFILLRAEIKEEREAENDVKAVVESAVEQPLESGK